VSRYLNAELCDSKGVSPTVAGRVAKSELGLKTKKGFYDYSDVDIPALMGKRSAQMEALLNLM
jgi:3-hydroxyacyl-CoA dehydrogenase